MKACETCGKIISEKKARRHKYRCNNKMYSVLKQDAHNKWKARKGIKTKGSEEQA